MGTKKKTQPAGNVFADATASLGGGVDAIFDAGGPRFTNLPLNMIDVRAQVRSLFEDDEDNSLAGLADSIKRYGVIQAVLVRPAGDGRYHLIAGERRYRASKLAGKTSIPALIRDDVADDAVEDVQFQENVQRQNLEQFDLARKVKADMDALGGDMDAVAAKHGKSKPWVSKILGLLTLPEQTARLVKEAISADLEVIGAVRQVEKKDKAAAEKLVDELKATRGKEDARAKAKAVREEVKPAKTPKASKAAAEQTTVATPKDRRAEAPGAVTATKPQRVFEKVWSLIEQRKRAETVLAALDEQETDVLTRELRAQFTDGQGTTNTAQAVIEGLRSGRFAPDGAGAVVLAAFLRGADATSSGDFRLDDILKAARA